MPRFPILPRAAEGDEGLQEVGEALFPRAFAGDTGGELGFVLRGVGKQAGEERHLFGECGGPRGFFPQGDFLRGVAGGGGWGFGCCCGRRSFWLFFGVDRNQRGLRVLEGRAQPADVAGGFSWARSALRATRRSSRASLAVACKSDQL